MTNNEYLLNQLDGELQERKDTKKILMFSYIVVTILILFNFSYLSLEENNALEFFVYSLDFCLFLVFAMYDTNKIDKKYDKQINECIKNTNQTNEKVYNTNSSYVNLAEEEIYNNKINNKNTNVSTNTNNYYEKEDYSVRTSTRRNYIELDDGDGGSYGAYVSDGEYAYHQDTH